jgi:hypothetical protein
MARMMPMLVRTMVELLQLDQLTQWQEELLLREGSLILGMDQVLQLCHL